MAWRLPCSFLIASVIEASPAVPKAPHRRGGAPDSALRCLRYWHSRRRRFYCQSMRQVRARRGSPHRCRRRQKAPWTCSASHVVVQGRDRDHTSESSGGPFCRMGCRPCLDASRSELTLRCQGGVQARQALHGAGRARDHRTCPPSREAARARTVAERVEPDPVQRSLAAAGRGPEDPELAAATPRQGAGHDSEQRCSQSRVAARPWKRRVGGQADPHGWSATAWAAGRLVTGLSRRLDLAKVADFEVHQGRLLGPSPGSPT